MVRYVDVQLFGLIMNQLAKVRTRGEKSSRGRREGKGGVIEMGTQETRF